MKYRINTGTAEHLHMLHRNKMRWQKIVITLYIKNCCMYRQALNIFRPTQLRDIFYFNKMMFTCL